jgi:cell division control protein 45
MLPQVEKGREMVDQKIPGVEGGKIGQNYRPGKGGIVVFDDGDIEEELGAEKESYLALMDMPEVEENGEDSDGSDTGSDTGSEDEDPAPKPGQKRKSWADQDEDESSDDDDRPRQRRRSNSVCILQYALYGWC